MKGEKIKLWKNKEFVAGTLLGGVSLPSLATGLGVVGLAYLFRKPAHLLLVKSLQGAMGVGQQIQELYHHAKEELEDIIAEAHYEHMKSKMDTSEGQE